MDEVIRIEGLEKRYGSTVAVDGLSLATRRGEIFGIVGPNGAGKTTTVETLIGLRAPDAGTVEVLGLDPVRGRSELVHRIGVQLQQANLPDRLKVWEALDLFASLYRKTVPWEPLLQRWGLTPKRDAMFSDLSGGQRQRLFVALALLNDPEIVFLDEITTGLDPQARRETWRLVSEIRDEGKSVVLVTHFMDEAHALCDRVAVIDRGKVIALGTPDELAREHAAATRLRFSIDDSIDPGFLERLPAVSEMAIEGKIVTLDGGEELLVQTVVALHERGFTPTDLRVRQVTLEDAFLELTGRSLRD